MATVSPTVREKAALGKQLLAGSYIDSKGAAVPVTVTLDDIIVKRRETVEKKNNKYASDSDDEIELPSNLSRVNSISTTSTVGTSINSGKFTLYEIRNKITFFFVEM